MIARIKIDTLAAQLQSAAASWNGKDEIKLGNVPVTITELNERIQRQLEAYNKFPERSLKESISTLQNLISAIDALNQKTTRRSFFKPALTQANALLSTAKETQIKLEGEISQTMLAAANEKIEKLLTNPPLIVRVRNVAYRLLKNLNDENSEIASHEIRGSFQLSSFASLKQNLEQFSGAYQYTLTERQQLQISQAMSMLDQGLGLSQKMLRLRELFDNFGGSTEAIIAQVADLAVEVRHAIDQLQEGQSLLIPGGFSNLQGRHAVLYEIKRMPLSEYHFSIFDTGGYEIGQENVKSTPKQVKVPLFTNLPKEALADSDFQFKLLSYFFINTEQGMHDVHRPIVDQLTVKYPGRLTTREFHDVQTWGTCSYDSVLSFLEYYLPPSIFHPFHFDLMLRSNSELFSFLENPEMMKIFSPYAVNLLYKGSCKTMTEWREKFAKHCQLDEDLKLVAQATHFKTEDEFKKYLYGMMSKFYDYQLPITLNKNYIAYIDLPIVITGILLSGYSRTAALGIGLGGAGHLVNDAIKFLLSPDLDDPKAKDIQAYAALINRLSPEAAKIIASRGETILVPDNLLAPPHPNLADLLNVDLSRTFNFLKDRFSEIALCGPLLNQTMSPLKEAIQNCQMLGA